MNKRAAASGTMLELWRPPQGAGDPIGCLATTYTFSPGLFDEHCLARFLEIESEPNREDLAFLLERERLLGGVYAGVMVDYTQAGVEHSLRWDVLPVRIPSGKQHAKLSLLAWNRHVRIIVASANLSEAGYRTNFEVAGAVDLTPGAVNAEVWSEAVELLRSLLSSVPGSSDQLPEIRRARTFLDDIERRVRKWESLGRDTTRQRLVVTLPGVAGRPRRSSLEEAVEECRKAGGSPTKARVASPFFDVEGDTSNATAALCKLMARGGSRQVRFCVPAMTDGDGNGIARLAAPRSLIRTPERYGATASVEILPEVEDRNRRPWHAKVLGLQADDYSALMIGSSNFTSAGMGVAPNRNAEANLLTIVLRGKFDRGLAQLEGLWPDMETVSDPESAEWLGGKSEEDDEQTAKASPLPAGFLGATYHAGDARRLVLRVEPGGLPAEWRIHSCGQDARELLSARAWREAGCALAVELPWTSPQPPEKLRVQWGDHDAFLPLNVDDAQLLPAPAQLAGMSADDMLRILAATDPGAAFRWWVKKQQPSETFDADVDSATPIDLDPLRRYDLRATFLHRVRRRARVLAQLRANLQRPVWGLQALEWRLRGMVGVQALADRLVKECTSAEGATDEALLTLADFLIVLNEVAYQSCEGSLSRAAFDGVFRPFIRELAGSLARQIEGRHSQMSADMGRFWDRVVTRCQE